MKTEEESITLIEQYLKGRLDDRMKRVVQLRIQIDQEFADEVRSMENVLNVIRTARKPLVKKPVAPVGKIASAKRKSLHRRMRWVWVAVLAGLLVFTGFVLGASFG